MTDLRGRMAAFLPRTLWSLLECGERSTRQEGCVLFADVAGFTPLTEGLARIGKEGAEELVRILNDFFEAMIGIAHQEGGDVLRFGGDAMTLFFPGGTGNGLRAALRMQDEARKFLAIETRGGTFPLAVKVGVSSGPVLMGIVGDDTVGLDYYAAGSALDLSAEAEHHAEKGMVALCPRCVEKVGRGFAGLEVLEDGFGLLRAPLEILLGSLGTKTPPGAAQDPPTLESLSAFLPGFIREKAALPQGLLVAEHRRTTTLFLTFKGLDYEGDPEVVDKVESVYREIAGAVRRYGGTVNKVDMGDKGSKALCLFGTPTALERQEEMGCRAAMEILESRSLRAVLQDLKIGVTTAPVFAAYVGCDERREYTVMGDGINLAARLMANSFAWKMLTSREVFDQASDALEFRALDPIFVKGKAEKVPIYRPEGEKDRAQGTAKARFVGREETLESILSRFADTEESCSLLLTGEAGVGKTAVLSRLRQGLDRRGIRYTLVPLASYSATTYMSAWRSILCSCLGVARTDSQEIRAEALRASVPPEDSEYLPLFNPLLDLDLPETAATQALAAKDRKDLSFAILARLIAGQARESPYGILIDNLESSDPASLEFLQILVAEGAGISLKILCTVRADAPKSVIEALGALEPLTLAPLSTAEIREYFLRIVGVPVPPESLLEFAEKRTHGNPKFLEQVVAALQREKVLYEDENGRLGVDEERLASTSFPDTLEGLLLSRADVLPEAERQLLKNASVLGTSFSMGLLGALLDEDVKAVLERVRSLEATGLVRMDNWGTRPYATFNDSLLRDALYESLNFAVKRQLHRKVASFLEGAGGGDSGLWPILARHYDAAGEEEKAADYFWMAAQDARSRYDNFSAFSYFDRLVNLREKRTADPGTDERYRQALLHLGEAYKNLGRLAEADGYCQKILDGTKHLFPERVTALRRIADNHRLRGDLKMALDLYRLAMLQARKLGDENQEAWILVDSSVPLAMSGRFQEAMNQLQQAERLSRRIKSHSTLVYALMNQGMCRYYGEGDLLEAIRLWKLARKVASQQGLKPNLANITNNLSHALYDMGEYRRAVEMATEGHAICKQFGYRNTAVILLANLALFQAMLGSWDESERTSEVALATARHHKMDYYAALSLHIQGLLLAPAGRFEEALERQGLSLRAQQEGGHSREAISCLNEILATANQLRLPDLATPSLSTEMPGLEGEIAQEGKAWTIGFRAQYALYRYLRRDLSSEEASREMMRAIEQSQALETKWLLAEVGEAALDLHREIGDIGGACRIGLSLWPLLSGHRCPLKVAPFCLELATCLWKMGDLTALGPVLRTLRRYEPVLDRGSNGVRYNALLAEIFFSKGAIGQARARRGAALRIVYAITTRMRREDIRRAFFSFPEVRETLRGIEPSARRTVARR